MTSKSSWLFYLRIICKAEIVFTDAYTFLILSIPENLKLENLINLFDFEPQEYCVNGLKTPNKAIDPIGFF